MDALERLPDQGKGDRQPSEMPIQSDEACPKAIADSEPPLQEASPKIILAIEHFQPILETLADLDRDDPKLAFQVARHVGLYRRLWASCVPKHLDGEISDRNDRTSKTGTLHLPIIH
ncbi:uncharacterized protein N7529_003463 [Penicillium soppii]|uniref:uncharacterized protein n=1 Tax=Penicillium soppii TaxID=69789 RepID=UPI0025486E43|nr:uncharacterized protein N7529_003463 [Penicillium soppii]KAJ5871110.1 hypothetical protein N7529_003463 [Penicillium soppii]